MTTLKRLIVFLAHWTFRKKIQMHHKKLIDQLVIDEGFSEPVYQDSEGFWTIGIGRMVDVRKGGGITRHEAEFLLQNDIDRSVGELVARLPWFAGLPEEKQRAMVNMNFNLGITKFMKFKNMLAAMRTGNYERAASEALNSKWARQVKGRAHRVAALIRQ